MIKVTFFKLDNIIFGFRISGHSRYAEDGSDIVCAAVSSAAYMTVNTVTDVQHINADVTEEDGDMLVSLSKDDAKKAEDILLGFELHLNALSKEYKQYIKVNYSEV